MKRALLVAALALASCDMPKEDARMLLAGAEAAVSQKPGLQRFQILAVTCGRVESCARGCSPVLEAMGDADPSERFELLRRCPDVARVVPKSDESQMLSSAQAFVLSRIQAIAPEAVKALDPKDAKKLTCDLALLQGAPAPNGC